MPEGTMVVKPTDSFEARAGLQLFPEGTWWSAFFVPADAATGARWWYVDVIRPAIRTAGRIEFVDLDLDVERLGDGAVKVLDEHEFEVNRAEMGYPADVCERVRSTAAEMADWMRSGREPFGVASIGWLRRARAQF